MQHDRTHYRRMHMPLPAVTSNESPSRHVVHGVHSVSAVDVQGPVWYVPSAQVAEHGSQMRSVTPVGARDSYSIAVQVSQAAHMLSRIPLQNKGHKCCERAAARYAHMIQVHSIWLTILYSHRCRRCNVRAGAGPIAWEYEATRLTRERTCKVWR